MGGVCSWICSFFLGFYQLDDDGAGFSGLVDGGISVSDSGSAVADLGAAAEFLVICVVGGRAGRRLFGEGAFLSSGIRLLRNRWDSGGRMAESSSARSGGIGRIHGDFGAVGGGAVAPKRAIHVRRQRPAPSGAVVGWGVAELLRSESRD